MAGQPEMLFMLNEMLDVSMEEQILLNSEDDEDINIFATLAVMMRRDLHRNEGFCEMTVPSYSIDEFQSHFRMTRMPQNVTFSSSHVPELVEH